LVFDGDDTRWVTEPLYDAARIAAGKPVAAVGLDSAAWDALERKIDVKNVSRFGLSRERFPTSCVEAYESLCCAAKLPIDGRIKEEVREAASTVFNIRAPLVPNVASTLAALKQTHDLYLLTQGDREVQQKRISDSGLAPYFSGAFITPLKSEAVLNQLLKAIGNSPEETTFIGNSVPSDINPALAIGMRAVWVDAHLDKTTEAPQGSPSTQSKDRSDLNRGQLCRPVVRIGRDPE